MGMAVTFHMHTVLRGVTMATHIPHNLLCPSVPLDCTRRTALIIGGSRCGSVRVGVNWGAASRGGPLRGGSSGEAPAESSCSQGEPRDLLPRGTIAPCGDARPSRSKPIGGRRKREESTHTLSPRFELTGDLRIPTAGVRNSPHTSSHAVAYASLSGTSALSGVRPPKTSVTTPTVCCSLHTPTGGTYLHSGSIPPESSLLLFTVVGKRRDLTVYQVSARVTGVHTDGGRTMQRFGRE